MLESIENVSALLFGGTTFFFLLLGWLLIFATCAKDRVCERTLLLGEHAVNHHLMRFSGMRELNNFGRFFIKVGISWGIILNWFLLVDELANVDASGFRLLFKEFNEFLQVFI